MLAHDIISHLSFHRTMHKQSGNCDGVATTPVYGTYMHFANFQWRTPYAMIYITVTHF